MANAQPRPAIEQPSDNSIRLIALTRGQVAIVDADLYEWLMQWNWYASKNSCTGAFYAERRGKSKYGEPKYIPLHRQIMGYTSPHIDHWSGNSLDCRVSNMRPCTTSQNHANQGIQKNNTSGYPGVAWLPSRSKWRSRISINTKQIHIGLFDSFEEAVTARQQAEKKYHGEFAYSSRHLASH